MNYPKVMLQSPWGALQAEFQDEVHVRLLPGQCVAINGVIYEPWLANWDWKPFGKGKGYVSYQAEIKRADNGLAATQSSQSKFRAWAAEEAVQQLNGLGDSYRHIAHSQRFIENSGEHLRNALKALNVSDKSAKAAGLTLPNYWADVKSILEMLTMEDK
jgi:hypothetical protein